VSILVPVGIFLAGLAAIVLCCFGLYLLLAAQEEKRHPWGREDRDGNFRDE